MTEKKLNKASVSSGENSGSSNISMKSLKKKRGQRIWSVQKSHSLLVGMQNGTTIVWKTV